MKLNNPKKIILASALLFLLSACATFITSKAIVCANNLESSITNFCEVNPNVLWRGAQPDEKGTAWLIEHGVQTIINLEELHNDINTIHRAALNTMGHYQIDYFRVKTWEPLYAFDFTQPLADEHVVHFLALMQYAKKPIYVHCREGQNRTGVMVAAYKIIYEGTQLSSILNEMQSYSGIWSKYTTEYLEGLANRRAEIMQKVANKLSTLEKPTQIICNQGKC
ncbi:MAG: dual specificity protein phosphatase family protein [Methylococcaceae bacterium]